MINMTPLIVHCALQKSYSCLVCSSNCTVGVSGVILTFLGKYFTNISLPKLFRSDRGDKLSLADFQNYTQGEDLMLGFLPNVTVSTV